MTTCRIFFVSVVPTVYTIMVKFDCKFLIYVLVFNVLSVMTESTDSNILFGRKRLQPAKNFVEIMQALSEVPKTVLDPPNISLQGIIGNPSLENMIDYKEGVATGDPKLHITQLTTKYGYPVETHYVKTADGYILKIFRIPSKNTESPVVLLQHGLLSCSDDWVTIGPNKGLAYLLADEGYDVWLSNSRGTKHSLEHESLSIRNEKYWDFSWDEIGRFDLPATIDYMLDNTKQEDILYVGHSQGTTAFYVLCAEVPEYNKKVRFMVSLAPIAFMKHNRSPVFRVLAPAGQDKDSIASIILGPTTFTNDTLPGILQPVLCYGSYIQSKICFNVQEFALGYDNAQIDYKALPTILGHQPAGASSKQLIHYAQSIREGKFRRYNYRNKELNKAMYGSEIPPDYPLQKITVPMAFFYSESDWAMALEDMKTLVKNLTNANVTLHRVPWKSFSHTDFLFSKDVVTLLYNDIIALLQKYSKK